MASDSCICGAPSQLTVISLCRYALLGGAAFSQGLSVGPLVNAAINIDPSVVLTAFLGTSTVFACFSAAALVARRRSWLYLGGQPQHSVHSVVALLSPLNTP